MCSSFLEFLAPFFGFVSSIILIIPKLNTKVSYEEDRIVASHGNGLYTQKKHLKERNLNIVGFIFLSIAFFLQMLFVLCN